jgi:hypothetical protein
MITQAVDPHHFIRRARQIKAQIPSLLTQWGLLPKFKRWRLAQDPETGTVVLFGVLDTQYIATQATTPFSDYFDPRLLSDLATELHVQVIPSATDGLRYSFILEEGLLDIPKDSETIDPPAPVKLPEPLAANETPIEPVASALDEDHAILHQRLDKFLKITEALDALDNATAPPSPDVLLMDDAEFNQQMADYEANRNHLKLL